MDFKVVSKKQAKKWSRKSNKAWIQEDGEQLFNSRKFMMQMLEEYTPLKY